MQACTMASARESAVGPRCTLALAWSAVLSHVTTGVWSVAALTWRMTGPRRDSRAPTPAAAAARPRPARSTLRRLIGRSKAGLLSPCEGMVSLSFVYLPLASVKGSSHHLGQDALDLRLCRQRDHPMGPAGESLARQVGVQHTLDVVGTGKLRHLQRDIVGRIVLGDDAVEGPVLGLYAERAGGQHGQIEVLEGRIALDAPHVGGDARR